MDGTSDLYWLAMLFTLLAVIVTAVFMGRNKALAPSKCSHQTRAVVEERAGPDPGVSSHHDKHRNKSNQQHIQTQSTAKSLKAKDETIKHEKVSSYSAL